MLPVITLIGRPNVGKSTLFNRLTRTRDALVADFPGLTRDRQYGVGQIGPKPYVIVDTGGIGTAPEGVEALMERQVLRAIDEADHLLFMVDARDGCSPEDIEISQRLRRLGKPITLVVNKSDSTDPTFATADFHRLGLGDPWPVSSTQGNGVRELIDRVFEQLPEAEGSIDGEDTQEGIRVAVVGRPNAGKSTLINRLLGEERLVTFDLPGTTRDSIFIPFERLGRHYTLIDTAGLRRRARVHEAIEKFSVIKTLQAIAAANVIILVIDAHQGIGEQDATLAGHIIESGRALVVAINKWDGLDTDQREQVKSQFQRKLAFLDFAKLHLISALHGSGVGLLLDEVEHAYANATRDLGTPVLTRLLEAAVQEHQPPIVHGRRIKLRYAHQGGRNPPIIVIHGNQTEAVPETYRRYLINRFRKELKLLGTPLRLEFKTGNNPFQGRRNQLTPRQVKQRQRLKEFTTRKR
ncbi:ribosome biogenesis GTPase Der [Thiocystis violascens]|uniref:GTPase Der n=1 Tax=Thiocystis violascens (strain ATCC 17096 / DSM 198 / 6111) TaxID=765911 RepID=I3YCC4_THIV6|nr:ribosome biogenesis GTPase Der [Thiocystis violascens]AFL74642.1 ribosome-associated GTPase EngA [Thiocystis violascens DSM 198]